MRPALHRCRLPVRAAAALCLVLSAGPSPAAAGADPVTTLLASGVREAAARRLVGLLSARGGLSDTDFAVLDLVGDVAARGLPVDRLLDKAFEGLAKGVPTDRILPLLERIASDLKRAADLVAALRAPGDQRPGLLEQVLDALAQGVSPTSEQQVVAATSPRDPARGVEALVAAAELEARGVPAEIAGSLLASGLRKGWSALDLRSAAPVLDDLVRHGGFAVDEAAWLLLQGARDGYAPADVRVDELAWGDGLRHGGAPWQDRTRDGGRPAAPIAPLPIVPDEGDLCEGQPEGLVAGGRSDPGRSPRPAR